MLTLVVLIWINKLLLDFIKYYFFPMKTTYDGMYTTVTFYQENPAQKI